MSNGDRKSTKGWRRELGGDRIPNGPGAGRNTAQYFAIETAISTERWEQLQKGVGTRNTRSV